MQRLFLYFKSTIQGHHCLMIFFFKFVFGLQGNKHEPCKRSWCPMIKLCKFWFEHICFLALFFSFLFFFKLQFLLFNFCFCFVFVLFFLFNTLYCSVIKMSSFMFNIICCVAVKVRGLQKNSGNIVIVQFKFICLHT